MLTCRRCWSDVPFDLQKAVYATVNLRKMGGGADATWAPWWRAQAKAIDAVLRAGVASGRWTEASSGMFDRALAKELLFADWLDGSVDTVDYERRKDALGAGSQ